MDAASVARKVEPDRAGSDAPFSTLNTSTARSKLYDR